MEEILRQIGQLLNNGAFWVFLGTCVTAFYTYKAAVLPALEERRKKKVLDGNGRADPNKATSFEELKAVVEILQRELERKDEAHNRELIRAYSRIEAVEGENEKLYKEIEKLKDRLHRAHINHE